MDCKILAWMEKHDPELSPYGFNSRITGTTDGKLWVVDVWCEFDGRDVEFEHVAGVTDVTQDPVFFDALSEDKDWTAGMNAAYKIYESLV